MEQPKAAPKPDYKLPPSTIISVKPSKVDLITAPGGLKVFRIEASEATVNGNLIKRIEFGKTTAVVTYFNKSSGELKPKYHFRLIDDYGIEVASFDDKWLIDSVRPGETAKENKSFVPKSPKDLLQFLEFSTISIDLPADWDTPVYLLIEGSDP